MTKEKVVALNSKHFIPRHGSFKELQKWVKSNVGCNMPTVWSTKLSPHIFKRNIENFAGTIQVPLGIAGPLLVKGAYAHGLYYLPFATTEGLLVDSYNRGMLTINQAGGAKVKLFQDQIDISPLFILKNESVDKFCEFLNKNFDNFKIVVKTKTSHGQLIKYEIQIIDFNHIVVTFFYKTGDAMGLNMINVATEEVCQYIKNKFPIENYYLRSNFSSDKKASYHNYSTGYGKMVLSSVTLSAVIIKNYLKTTLEKIYDFWQWSFISSQQSGMIGINAQYANGLAAIYLATGQDIAQVVNAATGTTVLEKKDDSLIFSVRLPSLVSGTVGGGTRLPSQSECLALMDCLEEGAAAKFSEIVASTILAGEISIFAALSAGTFAQGHAKKRSL